jgi:gamma-glutamyltranspeptidase/glutathione hydrolase
MDSVTVPGAVSGWVSLSERFGKLPFEKLFEPAIEYAEHGFPVSPIIAKLWKHGAEQLAQQPGFADNFLPNGLAPEAGEFYANRPLARSLRLIAETRGRAFYEGELAEKIESFAKNIMRECGYRISHHIKQTGAGRSPKNLMMLYYTKFHLMVRELRA